jgi:hypothetical protein
LDEDESHEPPEQLPLTVPAVAPDAVTDGVGHVLATQLVPDILYPVSHDWQTLAPSVMQLAEATATGDPLVQPHELAVHVSSCVGVWSLLASVGHETFAVPDGL